VQHALLAHALESGDYAAALVVTEALGRTAERMHRCRALALKNGDSDGLPPRLVLNLGGGPVGPRYTLVNEVPDEYLDIIVHGEPGGKPDK
jgi:hypothetical protein